MNIIALLNPSFLLAATDLQASGRIAGQVVMGLIFGLGALHCFNISRRPTANTKCALSLMCVLLVFTVSAGLQVAGAQDLDGVFKRVLLIFGGLAFIGLIVAALVLAIIGLVEYSQAPGRYSQGKAQAIWALVLCGVFGVAAMVGAVVGATRAGSLRAGNTKPSQTITNMAFNYYLRPPPPPWVNFDVSKINKVAKSGFIRRNPEGYFMVIAEAMEDGQDTDTEGLAEITKAQMAAATLELKEVSREPCSVNGLHGLLAGYEARMSIGRLFYLRWNCVTNGWAYQLVGWCKLTERARAEKEIKQLMDCFAQVDPQRRVSSRLGFETNYVSPRFHYQAKVADPGWRRFSNLEKDFPEAEFGALHSPDGALTVVPVWLGDMELSEEALSCALLSTMTISYPDPNLTNRRKFANRGQHGVQYDFERAISGTEFKYRLRCLQGDGYAYLVAAWVGQTDPNADAFLTDTLNRVSFDAPLMSASPTLTNFTRRDLQTRGHVFNEAGIFYFKARDYERALALFREAASSFAEEPTYTLNIVQAWSHLDRPKDALEYLEAHKAIMATKPELRAYQAFYQAELGMTDLALTNYAEIFAGGYRSDSHFTEYVNRLMAEQSYAVAQQEVERYLKPKDSVSIRLLEAEIYHAQRNYAHAIELLQAQHEKAPFNAEVANALAETLLDAGRYNEALELCKQSLKTSSDSAYPQFLKGRAELGLKWYRESKASFEEALKLAPSSTRVADYLNLVSSTLGEGSNTALKQPIQPVALPASLTNTAALAATTNYASDYGAYYSRRITAVYYQPGRECRTTDYIFLRVLDSSGVAAFSTFQVNFDPIGEDIFVNDLTVLDSAGALVSTGKVSDYYILDDRREDVATHRKTLNIPIAGLRPGCEIRLAVTRSELGRVEEFPGFEYYFSRSIPSQESIVFISGDTTGLKFGTSSGVEEKTYPEGRCWLAKDPLVARHEPLQSPAANYLPVLWVADHGASWPALATNYLHSIRDHLELDEATRELGLALVAGQTNQPGRLQAILRHVQTNYTYKAIEFGRRARTPNKTSDIARNKYGDCKDHSLLLVQLLEAAGIPAKLALVNYGGTVQKEFPSLDQFNHMVAYLPGINGGQFVDCTDKGCDAGHGVPYGLAKCDALILDGSQSHFVTVPEYPRTGDGVDVRRKITLASSANAAVHESITLKGLYASLMRSYLLQIPATSRRLVLQRQFTRDNKDVGEFQVTGLECPGTDMEISIKYPLAKPLRQEKDSFTGLIPAGMERPYLETDAVAKRLSPFEVRIPFNFHAAVEVTPPPAFAVQLLPASAPKLDPRFGEYQSRSQVENGALRLEVTGRNSVGKFTAQDYSAYRESLAQALALLEREILLKPVKP